LTIELLHRGEFTSSSSSFLVECLEFVRDIN
jgi:hypothetical protein